MTAEPAPFDPAAVRPVFVGVIIGLSLAAISQTLVATALPTMVGDLGGHGGLSLVISAYLLTSAIVVPFAGKLADLFGAGRLFRIAIGVFATGSLLAGLSTSMWMLIVARGVQGIGGGAIMTLAFTLIAHLVPARERGRYQGRVASVFALTSVTGPLVGGFFVDHLSWRWAFFTIVGLSALAAIAARRLPADERRDAHGVDVPGAVLLVLVLVSLMLVTVVGGQHAAWTSPLVVGLLVASVIGAVAFVRWEQRAPEPIVPVRLLRRRAVATATTLGFLSGVSMFAVIVYAPAFLQVSLGASATASGLLLVPLMGCMLVGSTAGGRIMSATGRYRRVAILGSASLVVGTGLLATMGPATPLGLPSLYVAVVGLGIGLTLPVTLVAVQNGVDRAQLGAATSITQFTRKIGSTLGVTALGALFSARVGHALDDASALLPPGTAPESLLETPAAIDALPDELAGIVRTAVADGSVACFVVAFAVAVLGLVVALWLPDEELIDAEPADDRPGEVDAGLPA